MLNFTEEERHRLDQIHKNQPDSVSADDAKLMIKWEKAITEAKTLSNQEVQNVQTEMQARLQIAQTQAQEASTTLQELKAAALARLERIDNGK